MIDSAKAFPVGGTLDQGTYTVTERLRGERWRGRYRGHSRSGEPVLVTTGGKQTLPLAELKQALTMAVDGITGLRHVGGLSGDPNVRHIEAMVEDEPPGLPSSELSVPVEPAVAVRLAREVGEVLMRANRAGVTLRQLPPELVYVKADGTSWRLALLAPRAPQFLHTATLPNFGVSTLFDFPFESPEVVGGHGTTPTSYSFVLGLLFVHWMTGEFPYDGDDLATRTMSLWLGPRRPVVLPPPLSDVFERALERDPSRRVPLGELLDALRSSRNQF